MSSHCLIIYGLLFSLAPMKAAHAYSCSSDKTSYTKMGRDVGFTTWQADSDVENKAQATTVQNPDSSVLTTTDLRSWRGQRALHHQSQQRNVHGILNIIGWGTLVPIGVIIARYFRDIPMKCSEWHSLHMLYQIAGFILGTIGWGIGLWVGNASKQYTYKTHRTLGTIIFTFATIQVFSSFLQPKKGHKYWVICHHLLGYALIALIIANIFVGAKRQSSAERWKWFYVGELGLLAAIALVLEILKCSKCKKIQPVMLNEDIYAYS